MENSCGLVRLSLNFEIGYLHILVLQSVLRLLSLLHQRELKCASILIDSRLELGNLLILF